MEESALNTLPKAERLCGKTSIERLLAKGRHGNVPGLRYCYLSESGNEGNRIMVSVPKKLFKRAVKRNRLKRLIRESWRLQKHNLHKTEGIDILFMYSTKEVLAFKEVYEAVGNIINRLNNEGKK